MYCIITCSLWTINLIEITYFYTWTLRGGAYTFVHPGKWEDTTLVPRTIDNSKFHLFPLFCCEYFQCFVGYFRTKEVPSKCPLFRTSVQRILWQRWKSGGFHDLWTHFQFLGKCSISTSGRNLTWLWGKG